MAKVLKFEPVEIGAKFRFDNDQILDGAKGIPFSSMVVIGETPDDGMYVVGTANVGETLILLERVKHRRQTAFRGTI